MQGKAKVLSADDDAKAAALQWASEAAFGNTEVAAPKILGDIVESLVGAVYIDTNHNFDKTWQVGLPPAIALPGLSQHETSLAFSKGCQAWVTQVSASRALHRGWLGGRGGGGPLGSTEGQGN